MTLRLKNIQNFVKFSMRTFEKDVEKLRAAASVQRFDLNILCTDTVYMNQLKTQHRINNNAQELVALSSSNQNLGGIESSKNSLGDIVLDIPVIALRGKEEIISVNNTMTIMAARGMVELLGCSDEADIYEHHLSILNRYNDLTGSNLEPLSGHEYFPINKYHASSAL